MMTHSYTFFSITLQNVISYTNLDHTYINQRNAPPTYTVKCEEKGANCHNRGLILYPYQAALPHIVPLLYYKEPLPRVNHHL